MRVLEGDLRRKHRLPSVTMVESLPRTFGEENPNRIWHVPETLSGQMAPDVRALPFR